MKKFNVAKSVDGEKKKSPPEKKIFYSLVMCVFAIALISGTFSAKNANKSEKSGELKQPEVSSEVYVPKASELVKESNATEVEGHKEGDYKSLKSEEIKEEETPSAVETFENSPQKDEVLKEGIPEKITKPVNGEILKLFSDKVPVYSKTMDDWRVHNGIDISAKIGSSVFACASGRVEEAFEDKNMGTTVVIDHGGYKSKYQNLSPRVTVKKGDEVNEGDTIGVVGDSATYEISDLPHLHFELYEGDIQKNPEKLFG